MFLGQIKPDFIQEAHERACCSLPSGLNACQQITICFDALWGLIWTCMLVFEPDVCYTRLRCQDWSGSAAWKPASVLEW